MTRENCVFCDGPVFGDQAADSEATAHRTCYERVDRALSRGDAEA